MEYAFGDITIACSNVDRVMFPVDGITKGELIAYYRDVAELMVPELRGRPLSVVRYTKGIDRGGRFDLARRAAVLVRAVFEQLGLPAFVKLTGGKGLHVIAPLDDDAAFNESASSRSGSARCCAGATPTF